MRGQQLPLAVQLRDTASYESFFAGPNAEPLQALRDTPTSLLLYGPAGSGKTHLLQACARAGGAAYLPLRELLAHGAEALDGYADVAALCLDDIDAVCAQPEWCLSLLRLLDQLQAGARRCVIAAAAPPERLAVGLPDLRTRLSARAVFGLRTLEDGHRAQLLLQRAQARGLELPDEVNQWLLTRLARDTGSLLAALDQLDRAALSAKRRLTLPFVQSVLAGAGARTAPAH